MICPYLTHGVATTAFWRTFRHDGKLAQSGAGGGVQAHPLSFHLPSHTKLQCSLQLSGQIYSPYFISTNICTLWSVPHKSSFLTLLKIFCCRVYRYGGIMALFMIFIIFNNHSQSTIIHSFLVRNSPRPAFLYPASFCSEMFSLPWNGSEWYSDSVKYTSSFFHGTELQVVFSSAGMVPEFRKLASIFVTRTGIPSFFSPAEWFGTEIREFA
jgi:hypothetical protein